MSPAHRSSGVKYRHRVLALLFLLSIITYIDRVCISIAGPRMQADLNMTPEQFGWVVGVFAIAYAAFEIPSGSMGDRIGPRKVLTRIVLWWSVFTSLTGLAWSYLVLLPIRFLFGAGEAGAYPNSSGSISRWFPTAERARAHGLVWMASRVGGALAPFMVIPIQMRFGWRASFFAFGFLGVIWAIAWYRWYRDYPTEKEGVTEEEIKEIGALPRTAHRGLPWRIALRRPNLWLIMVMYFTYCYGSFFFLSWMPTYLAKGRGFTERGLLFATLPFILGGLANLAGGFTSDVLVRKLGLKWGRRTVGIVGLGSAAVFTVATIASTNQYVGLVFLALSYAGSDFMLPTAWAVCLDVGKKYAGAVTGAMNTAGQIGSFISSVLFGYLVVYSNNWLPSMGLPLTSGLRDFRYDVPLVFMTVMLAISALLWFKIDPTEQLITED
ncbi:MAG TPA: MFS transporter [Bryobacteraceae bacterium]|nr:MFS transporter [Bryobacteraceae bacterium]